MRMHRHTVELDAVDGNCLVAEIMHIVGQSFNVCAIKAHVVVAGNEDLVTVRQAAEPFHETFSFLYGAILGDVSGVCHNVGFGQVW